MRNCEPHIYSYVEKNTGIHVVKAVAIYNGKAIYACSKCDPEDSFDLELGTKIALKRLDIKIAQKRAADKIAYAKFCKKNLEFIEAEKRRVKKSKERAEIAALDRRVEIKAFEKELAELIATTK